MNLYKIFTDETQEFFDKLKKHNVFYKRVLSGEVQVAEVTSFLQNVSFLTTYTPIHLTLAEKVSLERGYTALAKYFSDKRGEEVEHHRWGDADVAALKKKFKVPEEMIGITPEMKHFIKANENLIHDDPFAYFVYILFSEYFTVIAGPECMASIEKHRKIPAGMMTIIGKHAELDKHHVHHWQEESVQVGIKTQDVDRFKAAIHAVMDRYSAFAEALSKPHMKSAA